MARIYDAQGNRVRARQRTATFVDLSKAPRYDDALPEDLLYAVVVVPSKDGTPMIALVNPTMIATTEEVLDRIAAARQSLVDAGVERDQTLAAAVQQMSDTQKSMQTLQTSLQSTVQAQGTTEASLAAEIQRINTLNSNMQTMLANQNALIAQLAARKAVVPLGDVTVSQTASIALTTGERTFNVAAPGIVKATDTILLVNKNAYPAGYGLRGYSVPSNDNLSIVLQCPALILGGSFSIPFSVYAIR